MDNLKTFFKKEREGWRVRNIENLEIKNNQFNVFTIVCPLFKQGLLSESELIKEPNSLEESRIFNKWVELKATIKILHEECKKRGIELIVNIIFADKAIPLEKSRDVTESLDRNRKIWEIELKKLEKEIGCRCNEIILASDILPTVPDSVEINSIPELSSDREIVENVSNVLEEWSSCQVIDSSKMIMDKKKMEIVKKMRKFFGFKVTVALLLNYIVLDWKIVNLFDMDMIISIERFGLLLSLSKLTDRLGDIPQLEITVGK